MGFGLMMRDHEGKFVSAKRSMRMSLCDSVAAKALTAYFKVILGLENRCAKNDVEEDTKQIIGAIREKDKQDRMIGHLIDDVRLSLNNISEWKINHVFREANRVTHQQAKLVFK